MRIWLNPEKLAALEMTTTDITAALAEQNLQVAAVLLAATRSPIPGF